MWRIKYCVNGLSNGSQTRFIPFRRNRTGHRRGVSVKISNYNPLISSDWKRERVQTQFGEDQDSERFQIFGKNDEIIVLCQSERGVWYEQSRTDTRTHRAKHRYARYVLNVIPWTSPVKILVLGCGGASIPHELVYHHPSVKITVVDIAAEAITVGRHIVGDRKSEITWHLVDAREFLSNTGQYFDVIINDIFDTKEGEIPKWTISSDFLGMIKKRLESSGVYIQNILSADYRSHLRSLESHFNDVRTTPCHGPLIMVKNFVFTCHKI